MRNKEITEIKKIIAAWYADNADAYSNFRNMVDSALKDGDDKLFEEIFNMLNSFVPEKISDEVAESLEQADDEVECEDYIKVDCQDDPFKAIEEVARQESFNNLINEAITEMQPAIEVVEDNITRSIKGKDSRVFCYYYWMLFDNGPTEMAAMYSRYLKSKKVNFFWRWIIKRLYPIIVRNSFLYGTRKVDWEEYLNTEETEEGMESILVTLRQLKPVGGKRVDCRGLEDLVGNPDLISAIGDALNNRHTDVDIAYILMNLRLNDLIPDIPYTTFHRALINKFPDSGIKGHGKVQHEYTELRRMYKMRAEYPCRLSPRKQGIAKQKIESYNSYFLPFKS